MSKRKIYLDNTQVKEAREKFTRALERRGLGLMGPEEIPVTQGVGRITAAPVFAQNSSPHYHAAAMDGYALSAGATFGASERNPIRLAVPEQALPVDTGDPLPEGFNAVVMIENVQFDSESSEIEIIAPTPPWQHVRVMGEDMVATELILPANHRIRPYDLGSLLAGGISKITVRPRPKVAIIPTGSELVKPGTALKPGDIIEFNSPVLAALVREWNGSPLPFPIVGDDYEKLKKTIKKATEVADLVVINAGSSAGSEDFTAPLVDELGDLIVHGVGIRPGKPIVLGIVDGKPVFGIPGYPVSAVIAARLFLRPLLYKLQGILPPPPEEVEAVTSRRLVSALGAEEFVRVKLGKVGEKLIATPLARGAGVTMSLVRADGILTVPALSEGYNAGETVKVELWRPLEEIENTLLVIGSHDLSLDLLANELRLAFPRYNLSSAHVGSLGGILAIKRGETHLAGMHLLDEETGEYNINYLHRHLPGRSVALVTLVYREQGLILAPGNPKNINTLSDLRRPGVKFINRQRGSGTRVLLDYQLKQEGLDPEEIGGYQREEFTHMAVAAAVAGGTADAGMGIKAAAVSLGLDFIPLAKERYELAIPREYFSTEGIKALLTVIVSAAFQKPVEKLGGYDVSQTGEIRWV